MKQEKQKASPTIYSAINKESFAHFRILRNNCCRTVGGHAPAAFNWDTGILRSQPEMTNSTQQGICCSVVKYCSCLVLSLFPFADCVFNEILARTSCLHFFTTFWLDIACFPRIGRQELCFVIEKAIKSALRERELVLYFMGSIAF